MDWAFGSGTSLFQVVPSESYVEASYLGPVLHGEPDEVNIGMCHLVGTSHQSSSSSVGETRMCASHVERAVESNMAKDMIYSLRRQ